LVENCDIDCNDDNLCIKAGRDADGLRVNKPTKNVVYRNCITRAGHGLFTIGSETSGGVQNVEVYGLEAMGTNIGIRFKSAKVRGGVIDGIWFHDIKMKHVNHPFHLELNWYPEYSYPVIPDTFAEDEIPDTWKMMTTKVLPEEKGIPEFKNIRVTNVNVTGAKKAIYANAFPDKPLHHMIWENVSIEAEKGGSITHAADWSMDNVSITLNQGEPILLKNTKNINLPDSLVTKALTKTKDTLLEALDEKIKSVWKANPGSTIIPVNPIDQTLLYAEDSTAFSKKMMVYINPTTSSEMKYIEPLGDGFYWSPVTITYNKEDSFITIIGDKEHQWNIRMPLAEKPKHVYGVDSWSFNEEQAYLSIDIKAPKATIKME
jgi:polygalacturonase